jgi:hypothetical protein
MGCECGGFLVICQHGRFPLCIESDLFELLGALPVLTLRAVGFAGVETDTHRLCLPLETALSCAWIVRPLSRKTALRLHAKG